MKTNKKLALAISFIAVFSSTAVNSATCRLKAADGQFVTSVSGYTAYVASNGSHVTAPIAITSLSPSYPGNMLGCKAWALHNVNANFLNGGASINFACKNGDAIVDRCAAETQN